jgi:hypothetical protein
LVRIITAVVTQPARPSSISPGVLEFLGDEAEEGRQAGVGEGRQRHREAGERHVADQAAEQRDLACAGGVVDRPHRHEQRRLVEGVRHQVDREGLQAVVGVGAEQHGELAEHGDRGVGEHALEVGLADRQHRTDERGGGAHGDQDRPPARRAAECRVEAGEQIDARLHHGRRVQVGRHRRGRRHRVGQPEVEGQLRRLGEGADQHQHEDGRVERMVGDRLRRQPRELPAAADVAEQDQAGEQRQPAAAGDQQCLQRRAARFGLVMLEGDEQEGGDAGQLPENEHRDQVVGQHETEHGRHEAKQVGVEAAEVMMFGEVGAGVEGRSACRCR